ncbi:MAG TPA: aminoglycoside phosphotransferase family protein [Pyrinomonadaceae bacterium]|nr:aminoglycoside phosphotransferase family protein [Pyrinomonadaceae bacterium]
MGVGQLSERADELARAWGVAVERTLETASSLVAFGRRGAQPVVLKVSRATGDEWRSGEVLEAFGGRASVRVYAQVGGAALLERASPGTPLAKLSLGGRDEEATEILAEVIRRIHHPRATPGVFATVRDWERGFGRYVAGGDGQIPPRLVGQGRRLYAELCSTQREPALLLHGDLQHYNVLFDARRGWLAIDPKGVAGEIEYEIGAALRNPYERPTLFDSPAAVERRLRRYESVLKLDAGRALAWAFAQAVLSAIWTVEDGGAVDEQNPSLILANAIRPLL